MGYTIRCSGHNYVTLEYDDKFIFCLDNDTMKAEEIIFQVEKRTGKSFRDIPIKGIEDDFNGLLFYNGGWVRKFWEQFPSKEEVKAYMNLKNGCVKRR